MDRPTICRYIYWYLQKLSSPGTIQAIGFDGVATCSPGSLSSAIRKPRDCYCYARDAYKNQMYWSRNVCSIFEQWAIEVLCSHLGRWWRNALSDWKLHIECNVTARIYKRIWDKLQFLLYAVIALSVGYNAFFRCRKGSPPCLRQSPLCSLVLIAKLRWHWTVCSAIEKDADIVIMPPEIVDHASNEEPMDEDDPLPSTLHLML